MKRGRCGTTNGVVRNVDGENGKTMTQEEQLAELDAATRSIALVRDAIAHTNTDQALILIEAAYTKLNRVIDTTIAAQEDLDKAKAALSAEPVPPPTGYTATTDRDTRPKPTPLALGLAGFRFTDPAFGSTLIRATDEHTASGASMRVPSNSHLASWNVDTSRFYSVSEHGNAVFFDFDGQTVTRLSVDTGSYVEPAFSYVDRDRVFCVGGSNYRTVYTYDLVTGQSVVVCDLDRRYPNLALTGYCGSIETTDGDLWTIFFGGASQDQHRYVHHSQVGLLDVVARCGIHIHATCMDRTGRYVIICATSADIQAGKPQMTIWDTQTDALTGITERGGGHDCVGYQVWINQDCCTETRYDGMQWQYRALGNPNVTRDLIVPPLEPQEIYISDHSSWRNNTGENREPFFSFTYRRTPAGTEPVPWRAWDDEVICVSPDGQGVVHRFCHHQSISDEFWAMPIGAVSPNGRWATFTSNWGKTLPNARQDVFLVHLV